jgi:probable rRNA maturation factor
MTDAAVSSSRSITLANRQRKVALDLRWLREFAPVALAFCEGKGIASGAPLESIEEIEVSFVSDAVIADVHQKFMNVPGATDIITFDHGELVISAETAKRQARQFGQPLHHELGLYIIHGILHLNGYDDTTKAAAARMHKVQAAILAETLNALPAGPR